jgi:hypothetical protein
MFVLCGKFYWWRTKSAQSHNTRGGGGNVWNLADKVNTTEPIKPPRKRKNEVIYSKLLKGKLNHLTPEDRLHIEPVLVKYAHIFHDEETNDFKGTRVIEHQIPVGDAQPIRRPHTERRMHFEARWNNKCRKCSKRALSVKVTPRDQHRRF